METQKHIEDLLKKFKQGGLSPMEAKELTSILKEGDDNEDLKDVLENLWRKLQETDISVPTDQLFNNIKQNLQIESESRSVPQRKPSILKLKAILRYAAIVILSVGLTWFAKDYFTGKDNKLIADNASGASNEITVSYGSKSKVTLPDGSVVKLNSGSTLRYPARFDHFTRNVYIEGEAFFDVKKDPKHPFFVRTKDITIKVLGTKFNVKSYEDEKTIQTTLVSGSIELYSNRNEMTEKNRLLVLKPNQQVIFEKLKEEITVTDKKRNYDDTNAELSEHLTLDSEIDVAPVIAWKDNRLVFRDERFFELSKKLERWYDVEIEIKDNKLANALFSGTFVKETIEQALNALKLATPFKYQMNRNHIIITK
ncbi:MAG TPA: FecR domain-containing protein [Bacteroidales bacterium]